jgi:hypothetical protein
MEEEIELLKVKLYRLMEETSYLYSNEIVKLSQQLDKLICKYYLTIKSV